VTASALTRPGERDRISSKLAELDWRVIGLLCVLAGIGTAMLYSIAGGSWSPWAWKHLLRFGVLLGVMIGLAMVHPKWWFHAAYPLYGLLLFMVLLIEFTPMGYVAGGAKNWLNLGFIRIQPAEFVKIGLVLALARWYHGHSAQDARWSWKLVFPLGMIGVPFLLVAKQPDLGSAMVIGLTGAAVMFMAGLSWRVIAAAAAAAVAIIPPFVMFVMHDYQRNRVLTFLNPEAAGQGLRPGQSEPAGVPAGTPYRLHLLDRVRGVRLCRLVHRAGLLYRTDPDLAAYRGAVAQSFRSHQRSRHDRLPGVVRPDQWGHGDGSGARRGRAHAAALLWRIDHDDGDDRLWPDPLDPRASLCRVA
jgi:hypothetical protein